MQEAPTKQQIDRAIDNAACAAAGARTTRLRHRGKKRLSRDEEIAAALEVCNTAGIALRRLIGMVFAHNLEEHELPMKRVRIDMERERRKLAKML